MYTRRGMGSVATFPKITLPLGTILLAVSAMVAQVPSPALLVLNKSENTLSIIDPLNGKTLGRVSTGEAPHELTTSTDGRTVFVANYGDHEPGRTISMIDLASRKELRRIDLGALRRPHGIAYSGNKVYFTAETNKLIGRYDPAGNQIDWLLGIGQDITHMLLLSMDGNTIFTSNIGSDSISIIERISDPPNWRVTVVKVGHGPEGIDISPDGREVWSAHSRDGGVSIIEVASRNVIDSLNLNMKRANRLKFSPNGKLVLISDLDAGELLVLNASERKEIKRIKIGKMPEGVLIAPDGSQAYVAVWGENSVAVIDLKTFEVIRRIPTGLGPDGLAWAESR
jgi:YVTN family beta-propeller protein